MIELPPRRSRYETTLSGEDIRRLFEVRLDAREPEVELHAEAAQLPLGCAYRRNERS